MDYRSAGNVPGLLNFDSDRSTTLESLRNLMAFSQRPKQAPHKNNQAAAKSTRSHMPPQFREPPSSVGSHGTITSSSIQLDDRAAHDDLTSDSTPTSTLSAGPDAESTRASLHYQRGSHRVRKSTGRFGSNGARDGEKKTATDILSGVVNTSALFRNFKEWKPESEPTETGIYEDADVNSSHHDNDQDPESTTNFGVLDNLAYFEKENCGPIPSSPLVAAQHKPKSSRPLAEAPARRNRNVMQPTVHTESDMSIVMSTAFQKTKAAKGAVSQPARKASAAVPARASALNVGRSSAAVRESGNVANRARPEVPAPEDSLIMDELSSPETSANTREDLDLGIGHNLISAPPAPAPAPKLAVAVAKTDSNDAVTNQSFIVPSKSFPLLHNLVTGTLRFTPGSYIYGLSADMQHKYQLPAGKLPEDEKEIFVDIESIRDEVKRLQEHDEMLQNEIIQGEIKYKALLERFYSVASKAPETGLGSDLAQPLQESRDQNELLHHKVMELETSLNITRTQYEEQIRAYGNLAAERDTAVTRANSAVDKIKKLTADLAALRERLATSSQRPGQEAQRRIQQLEQMVVEREHVIKALKDERNAANSSHREECRLHRDRIARMEAEKSMLSGDHAKCHEEKSALATAKDALAQQNTVLREKARAARQHGKDREAAVHAIVEQQRNKITKLQVLLREREKSIQQVDEQFQKFRDSLLVREEVRMRTDEVSGRLNAVGAPERQAEMDDLDDEDDADYDDDKADDEESDSGSDSGHSDMYDSMDDNMTSAFLMHDLDFPTETVEAREDRQDVDEQELEEELVQVREAAEREAELKASGSATTRTAQQKSVSFQTTNTAPHATRSSVASTTTTAATVCRHNRVNCVICCQKAGPVGENLKVTVAVPRPIPARGAELEQKQRQRQLLPDPTMDPGSALAYVMKLLDDERRHLWMQIQAMRKQGEAEEGRNDKQRPRQALREAEELWKAYVLKVEQLNRLDDVLEGQREAGQDMTREEIDVTITRILEA